MQPCIICTSWVCNIGAVLRQSEAGGFEVEIKDNGEGIESRASRLAFVVARACGWRATNGSHEDEVWRGDISDTQPKEERERTSDGRIRLNMVY